MAKKAAKTGVIYVATGPEYLDLARRSLVTLKKTNPSLAADLFTDAPEAAKGAGFDRVHRIDTPHARSKIDCMGLSRFERTLYLDCDTLVLAPFGELFRLLERFEIAVAHDVRRLSGLIQQGHAHATPYAFPQMNSGVVLYRKSEVMERFLAEWAKRFRASGVARDQIILKDLLWESDIRFYVLPPEFNLRRVTLLDAWEPLDARPTILHSHRFMEHIRKPGAAPIREVGDLLHRERDALVEEWTARGILPEDRREAEEVLRVLLGPAG
ncbi:MAG: hypothetical protein HKN63_03635 [Rhodobacteraceae bacterium]|nr:hypothetical protein [Paracoccaceae bacterium]